jgi:hypothetical protein
MNKEQVLNSVKSHLEQIQDDEPLIHQFLSELESITNFYRQFPSLEGLSEEELLVMREKLQKSILLPLMPESATLKLKQKIAKINSILGEGL